MSLTAQRPVPPPMLTPKDLLGRYHQHVWAPADRQAGRWARWRAASRFLGCHPDLAALDGPSDRGPARRPAAQQLLAVAVLAFRRWLSEPRPGAAAGQAGWGGAAAFWAERHRQGVARLADPGQALGWSGNWIRQVSVLAACTICLWTGKEPMQLAGQDFAALLGALDALAAVSVSARHHVRTRLFALQEACYQLGMLTVPSRHGGPGRRGPAELAGGITQPDIRREVIRYATTLSTTLRPASTSAQGCWMESGMLDGVVLPPGLTLLS